jgi:hypothetical protein
MHETGTATGESKATLRGLRHRHDDDRHDDNRHDDNRHDDQHDALQDGLRPFRLRPDPGWVWGHADLLWLLRRVSIDLHAFMCGRLNDRLRVLR